jgi:chemotaxis protein MotB
MSPSVASSEKTRRTAHVTTALLAAASIAIAGCVSNGRFTEVQQERDLLEARSQELKNQADEANQAREALAKEKATLAQEKEALASQKAALEVSLADLKTKEEALGSKLAEREEESKRLKATYDGLVGSLKKELQAGQIQVQQLRDGLRVNVAQDILFDSGSAEVDKNGIEVLNRVAVQLKKSSHQIMVTGHTDNKPIGPALVKRYPSNWELAGARAASVVRLFADSGLPDKRLLAVSMADVHPVASNSTPEGRAHNRRIEIRLRPVPSED